jgi:hypothetical protein
MPGIEMLPTVIVWLIIATLVIIPAWHILRKAGFIPALSLLLIVPLLGWFCAIIVLAFVPWPALKRGSHADIASTFE